MLFGVLLLACLVVDSPEILFFPLAFENILLRGGQPRGAEEILLEPYWVAVRVFLPDEIGLKEHSPHVHATGHHGKQNKQNREIKFNSKGKREGKLSFNGFQLQFQRAESM